MIFATTTVCVELSAPAFMFLFDSLNQTCLRIKTLRRDINEKFMELTNDLLQECLTVW